MRDGILLDGLASLKPIDCGKAARAELLERSAEKATAETMHEYWFRVRRFYDGLVGWAYGRYSKIRE